MEQGAEHTVVTHGNQQVGERPAGVGARVAAPRRAGPVGPVLGTAFGLAAVVELGSALLGLPVPRTDAAAFLPAAMEFHARGTLTEQLYPLAREIDPSGAARFLFHGPLFPWLVGALMPGSTPTAAFLVVAALNVLALAGFTLGAHRVLTSRTDVRHPRTVLAAAVLMIAALTGMSLPTVGRPESLGALLALVVLTAMYRRDDRWGRATVAVALGLLGATQPAGSLLLAVALVGSFAYRYRVREAVIAGATTVLGGAAVAVAVVALSPNGLMDTVRGISVHLTYLADRAPSGVVDSVRYSLFWWDRFFVAVFFVVLTVGGVRWLRRHRARIASPGLLWATAAVGAVLVWALAVRVPATNYNLTQFTAVACLALLALAVRSRRSVLPVALVLVGLVSSLALVKTGSEVLGSVRDGPTLDEGRAQAARALPPTGCVLVDERSWVLLPDVARGREELDRRPLPALTAGCGPDAAFLLMPALGTPCAPLTAPPGVTRIDRDTRAPVAATVLGHSLTGFPPGYGFCIGHIESPPGS